MSTCTRNTGNTLQEQAGNKQADYTVQQTEAN